MAMAGGPMGWMALPVADAAITGRCAGAARHQPGDCRAAGEASFDRATTGAEDHQPSNQTRTFPAGSGDCRRPGCQCAKVSANFPSDYSYALKLGLKLGRQLAQKSGNDRL